MHALLSKLDKAVMVLVQRGGSHVNRHPSSLCIQLRTACRWMAAVVPPDTRTLVSLWINDFGTMAGYIILRQYPYYTYLAHHP